MNSYITSDLSINYHNSYNEDIEFKTAEQMLNITKRSNAKCNNKFLLKEISRVMIEIEKNARRGLYYVHIPLPKEYKTNYLDWLNPIRTYFQQLGYQTYFLNRDNNYLEIEWKEVCRYRIKGY
jgi:hypothetical protein